MLGGRLSQPSPCSRQLQDSADRSTSCASRVADAAKRNNLAAFFPGFFPMIQNQLDMGFTMVLASNDGMLLTMGLRRDLNTAHKTLVEFKEKREQEKKKENKAT